MLSGGRSIPLNIASLTLTKLYFGYVEGRKWVSKDVDTLKHPFVDLIQVPFRPPRMMKISFKTLKNSFLDIYKVSFSTAEGQNEFARLLNTWIIVSPTYKKSHFELQMTHNVKFRGLVNTRIIALPKSPRSNFGLHRRHKISKGDLATLWSNAFSNTRKSHFLLV